MAFSFAIIFGEICCTDINLTSMVPPQDSPGVVVELQNSNQGILKGWRIRSTEGVRECVE